MIRRSLALVAVVLVVAACGGSTASTGSTGGNKAPLKLGVVLSTTGAVAVYGLPQQTAVQLAVDKINAAGGASGHRIDLQILDDGSQPPKSATMFRQLYDSGVNLTIGPTFLGALTADGPVITATSVPHIVLTGVSTTGDFTQSNLFKLIPAQEIQAQAVLRFAAKKLNAKKVAMITSDDSYGQIQRTSMLKYAAQNGITLVSDEKVEPGTTDATPQVSKLAKDADLIMILAINPLTVTVLKAIQQLGLDKPMLGGIGFSQATAVQPAGTLKGTLYSLSLFNADDPQPNQKAFISAYQQKTGQLPPFTAGQAWDSVQLAAEAVKLGGGVTADQIKAGLAKISKYQGVDGAYTFDPSTHEMFPVDSISFVQYQSNGTYKAVK